MAFVWAQPAVVTPGVTEAQAATMNELKTNTDTLADNLLIAHYAWAELPVAVDEEIQLVHLNELHNALDYIDNNNLCTLERATNLGSYCASYYIPNDVVINGVECSGACSSNYKKN
jgi:hypothetical protein